MERSDLIKGGAAAIVLVGAVVFAAVKLSHPNDGEDHIQGWFYDESEQKLFLADKDSVPPIAGVGGAPDDGVRAMVVACSGECGDPEKQRIAYLEKYGPELKQHFEAVRAARAKGERYTGQMPSREGDFKSKNTFVRRPGETEWHAENTKEGAKIMVEWQQWPCASGKPVVCTPE